MVVAEAVELEVGRVEEGRARHGAVVDVALGVAARLPRRAYLWIQAIYRHFGRVLAYAGGRHLW